MELVDAVEPHVSAQVRAMIQLQLHSLARLGEIVKLRVCDHFEQVDSGIDASTIMKCGR